MKSLISSTARRRTLASALFLASVAGTGCAVEAADTEHVGESQEALASPSPTRGKGVLIWYYTGSDTKYTKFAQSTVNFSSIYEHYDRKVFLAQDTTLGGIDLDANAKSDADVWAEPTAENLQKYLKEMTDKGYLIDIFIVAHGSTKSFVASDGKGGTTSLTARALEKMPAAAGYSYFPIRMVYQGQCYGETFNASWRKIGAMATNGTRYVNFYPNQIGKFVSEWNAGAAMSTGLSRANTTSSRTVVQSYILSQAILSRDAWGGCPAFQTVLGDTECANTYFESEWLGNDFQDKGTGKDIMNWSSERILSGSSSVTRTTAYKYSAP